MFANIKKIDTHVHFRDFQQSYKETVKGGLKKAADIGLIAVFDMPNTKPPILWEKDVVARLELAEKAESSVEYFIWMGLTSSIKQIEKAVRVYKFPQVVGFKLYAGPTTGDLCVADEIDQKKVYQALSRLGHKGVIAVHCEKESMLKPELWNSKEPWTYGLSRPPEAEMEAVKDQIRFIKGTGFQGHVHICHVSLPETIRIIKEAREQGLNISCEITPHHALLNEDKMREKDGLMYKVNPPLRKPGYQKKLKEMLISLIQEGVDWLWISTDYAPHTGEEKMKPDGPSGIADYSLYIQLLNNLMEKVLVPKMIEKFTYHNILKAFLPEFKLIPR